MIPILIKKIVWMLILWIRKYFIWISVTLKVIEGYKSSSNFIVNASISKLCGSLSLILHLVLSSPLFLIFSLYIPLFLPLLLYTNINLYSEKCFNKMKYNLKGHMRPLLCRKIFKNVQIFWSKYNIDLRSYGQLLSLYPQK